MNTSRTTGWADLPKELLELIGERLRSRIDVYRFRAICTSWRSVVPLSHLSSSPPPPLQLPAPISASLSLFPFTICRLEDEPRNAACLIKVTESPSGELKVMHPLRPLFSPSHLIAPLLNSCKIVDVLSLRVVELYKGYSFKVDSSLSNINAVKVHKVVLFGEIGILVIYDTGKLLFWGFGDENCRDLGVGESRYHDIVVHKGQCYVVDSFGTISWIDSNSVNLVQFSPPLFGWGQFKNIVISNGQMFVVDSFLDETRPQKPLGFERGDIKVYRLDEDWGTWVDVESLGDRAFVLGKEGCFSVSTTDFPGCHRDCIYFNDSKFSENQLPEWKRRYFPRVFDIDDRRRMKMVDCCPSHRKLFSPSMNFPVQCMSSP